jgi:hypothetical protein
MASDADEINDSTEEFWPKQTEQRKPSTSQSAANIIANLECCRIVYDTSLIVLEALLNHLQRMTWVYSTRRRTDSFGGLGGCRFRTKSRIAVCFACVSRFLGQIKFEL